MVVVEQRGVSKAADFLGLKQPTISAALKRLEDTTGHTLIERKPNPEDGRGKLVTLTAAGKRMAKRGWKVQKEVVATMAEALSARELDEVAKTMRRLRVALSPLLDATEES
jgi:DNA-binding MarR family transcriptional regulator